MPPYTDRSIDVSDAVRIDQFCCGVSQRLLPKDEAMPIMLEVIIQRNQGFMEELGAMIRPTDAPLTCLTRRSVIMNVATN